jgi:amino acid permease
MSGTIGMGLFIRTGQVISLAGGLGSVIAYVVGGIMITCVMLCLSEMVAFRHEAGAIFEYPKLFVSHALGFAVGIIYWQDYRKSF